MLLAIDLIIEKDYYPDSYDYGGTSLFRKLCAIKPNHFAFLSAICDCFVVYMLVNKQFIVY